MAGISSRVKKETEAKKITCCYILITKKLVFVTVGGSACWEFSWDDLKVVFMSLSDDRNLLSNFDGCVRGVNFNWFTSENQLH